MPTVKLTKATFEDVVTTGTVLGDFWASWCGPCRMFGPVFEAASEEHADLVLAKVDTEDQTELAAERVIISIPALMVFRDQVLVYSRPGALPPASLEDLISQVRALDMDEVRRQIATTEVSRTA